VGGTGRTARSPKAPRTSIANSSTPARRRRPDAGSTGRHSGGACLTVDIGNLLATCPATAREQLYAPAE